MTIVKNADGSLHLGLTGEELEWFGQTLNECRNGFGVADFEGTIGIDEAAAQRMLERIGGMYAAAVGHEA